MRLERERGRWAATGRRKSRSEIGK